MEKPLNFVLKLRLEEMALRRVVINLWMETDILDSIVNGRIDEIHNAKGKKMNSQDAYFTISLEDVRKAQLHYFKKEEEWRVIENEVKSKLDQLVLPELLKKRMVHVVRPIGLQLRSWKIFTDNFFSDSRLDLDICLLKKLWWTSAGAVDYQKTAEKLINLETLDVVTRYKLACVHFFEDSIPRLWEELSEEKKSCFYDETGGSVFSEMQMEFYWTSIMKGEEYKLNNVAKWYYGDDNAEFASHALEESIRQGNKVAIGYFYQKLSCDKRDDVLIECFNRVAENLCGLEAVRLGIEFPKRKRCDILCYVLSMLSHDQLMKVLKYHAPLVLSCFLDWPWQDLFLDIADFIWTFFPKTLYANIGSKIYETITDAGYYLPDLFQNFFLRSPIGFRESFVRAFSRLLFEFPYDEDAETIKVVFRNIYHDNRWQIIYRGCLVSILANFMRSDKLDLFELCLQEAAPSKKARRRVKGSVMSELSEEFRDKKFDKYQIRRMKRCFK